MKLNVDPDLLPVLEGYDPLSRDHHYLFMCLLMTSSDLSDQSKDFRNSKAIAVSATRLAGSDGCASQYELIPFYGQLHFKHQTALNWLAQRVFFLRKTSTANSSHKVILRSKWEQVQWRWWIVTVRLYQKSSSTLWIPLLFQSSSMYIIFSNMEEWSSLRIYFRMVAQLVPEGMSTFEAITLNRQCWAALDEILVERGNRPVLGLDYLRDDELEKQVLERVRQKKKQQNKVCDRFRFFLPPDEHFISAPVLTACQAIR